MNALAIKKNHTNLSIQDEARTHIEILSDLLRDIDLEKRMGTLIQTENLIKEWNQGEEENKTKLESIRLELEGDLQQVRLMIHMVEKAQFLIET